MFGTRLATTALAATFALGATALPSLARDGAPQGMGHAPAEMGFIYLLKTSDTNKDGKITKEEALAFQNGRFEEIDVNSDGVITPGEYQTFRKAQMDAYLKDHPRPEGMDGPKGKMAANDDADAPAKPGPGAKMADKDGPAGPGKRHHMAMNDDSHHGWNMHRAGDHHGRWGKPHSGQMERIFFVRADTDKSGQVSAEEFTALAEKMFTRMDTNGDMVITVDDLPDRPMMPR